MTLVEMLIAMGIMTIIMLGTSLFVIHIWKSNKFTVQSGIATLIASQGVENIIGVIRNARQSDNGSYPIVSATANDLVLYGDFEKDGVTEKLHYYLDSGVLYVGVTEPTTDVPPVYPAGDQSTQIIADNVANTGLENVFTYYDINNADIGSSPDIFDIKMVKVFLSVDIDPSHSPDPIDFESYASIRNLSEYDRFE